MNRLEPDQSQVLARARRAFSPTASDADRVRVSLRAALAMNPPVAAPDPSATAGRLSRVAMRLFVAGAIAASSGAIGYRMGRRAAPSEPRAPISVPVAPAIIADPAGATAPANGLPAVGAAEPRPRPGQATTSVARPPRRSESRPGHSLDPDSLVREIEALRSVERALRDGTPGLALALLRELDRTLPEGKLTEERRATAAIARCASGAVPLGLDLAKEFGSDYPDSVYRERVEEACAQTDLERAGDTASRRHQP